MRAIRSIINVARIIKHKDFELNQSKLLKRVLKNINVFKMLTIKLPLFENIINNLFSGVE